MMPHPLDRPVWQALTGDHVALGLGDARARRYRPEVNLFGAAATPADLVTLADLTAPCAELGLVEVDPWPVPPGMTRISEAVIDQMVALGPPADPAVDALDLTPADGPDVVVLATLCKPGPFTTETWRMGTFIGLREGGELIAMAGQRWRAPGYIEVSAVCTRPEARGRGLARRLIATQMHRIEAAGARPFLHVYPDNAAAIALYESLGFRKRAELRFMVVSRC